MAATIEQDKQISRLENALAAYIEESRADRREMRQEMKLLSTAVLNLAALQMQDHRNFTSPVPEPRDNVTG